MITSFNPDKLLSQLQTILSSTSSDLNQLCKTFFEQAVVSSSTDLQALELAYLQLKTGSTSSSIPDLWKTYLLQLGYSEYPFDAFNNALIVAAAISLAEEEGLFELGDLVGTGTVDGMVVVLEAPSQPVASAAPGNTEVTIGLVSGGAGAASFDIKWGTVAGVRGTTISGVTLPYVHTGRTNGVEYFYSIVATNAAGSTESAEVSAIPDAAVVNETFTTDLGAFSVVSGAVAVTGGYAPINGTDSLVAACSLSKGCYVEADIFMSLDYGSFRIALNNSATNILSNGYSIILAHGNDEDDGDYRNGIIYKTNGTTDIDCDTPCGSYQPGETFDSVITVRMELLANNTVLLKYNGVTVGTGADNDYSSFTHLWIHNNNIAAVDARVYNIKAGSL